MDATIWCALIASVSTIISSFMALKMSKIQKKSDEDRRRVEARAERRAKESELSMNLMFGACSLSLVTAKKMANMQTNGDVEEAMEAAREAQVKYKEFVQEQAATNFAKV